MHGANAALTVSIQPLKRKKRTRRLVDGEEWGAFHAHLLWKRRETGAVARIKQLLAESSELLTAIWAAHGVSRGGAAITHKTLLAEALADRAWATFDEADRQPWQVAADKAKRFVENVDWSSLDGALDKSAIDNYKYDEDW